MVCGTSGARSLGQDMDQEAARKCILIVDDTPENIDVLLGILGEQYKIRIALNGEKALALATVEPPPDLILLDIMMPGMNGYEVCRRLKGDVALSSIPVIFLTAKGKDEDEAMGFALGAVDYITKPVSPPVVKARVETHLALDDQKCHLESLVRERTAQLKKTRLQIIRRLGVAAEFKDNETGMHIMRMSHVCQLLGKAHGLRDEHAEVLLNASPMHDIGKIGIPDDILLKPGRLDTEEWHVMQKHTIKGALILGQHSSEPLKTARLVALTHHEKWNGEGYPEGLAGDDIPLAGRIAAIADVYDALISKRPYKDPWPQDKAVDLIRGEAGKHFDPDLVALFLKHLPEIERISVRYADGEELRPGRQAESGVNEETT